MKSFSQKAVMKVQSFKDRNLSKIGKAFLRLGISANLMTGVSLIFGVLSIYFLFVDYWTFFILAIFHLLADGLDGVIARVGKTTAFGDYFDYFSDRLVVVLIYISLYLILKDYVVLIVLFLYLLNQVIYLASKKTYPIIFYRTVGLLLMALHPLFPLAEYLTFCYLFGGAFTMFSLALQLKYYVENKIKE
jgi:phosphatidylglycerophosphate synthase